MLAVKKHKYHIKCKSKRIRTEGIEQGKVAQMAETESSTELPSLNKIDQFKLLILWKYSTESPNRITNEK